MSLLIITLLLTPAFASPGLEQINKEFSCSNGFPSQYCFQEECMTEQQLFMWDHDSQWGKKEYTLSFSATPGNYTCTITATTGYFDYKYTTPPQYNEKTDVYLNGLYVGTTKDEWCPPDPGTTDGNGEDGEDTYCCHYESVNYETLKPKTSLNGATSLCFQITDASKLSGEKATVLAVAGAGNAHYISIRHRTEKPERCGGTPPCLEPRAGFCMGCEKLGTGCDWCADSTGKYIKAVSGQTYKLSWGDYSVTLENLDTGEKTKLNFPEYEAYGYSGLRLSYYCLGGDGCQWIQHNSYPDSPKAAGIKKVDCSTTNKCGNGVVDSGEQCDGNNLNGKTCNTVYDYEGGTLKCGSDCKFDTSLCYYEYKACNWKYQECRTYKDYSTNYPDTCENDYNCG